MTMVLETNGVTYDGFKSAKASMCMEDLSGTFSFHSVNIKDIFTPIKIGNPCRVLVNGHSVINGYAEQIDADYDEKSHNILISGRDKTCDVIDSSIGSGLTFSGGITLVELTKRTLSQMNITGVNVSSTLSIAPFESTDIETSEVCETIYSFLQKYAKKRQVIMTTDGNGNIVFVRSSNQVIKTILTSSYNAKSTILNAALHLDYTKRFYKYILNAQINPSAEGALTPSYVQMSKKTGTTAEKDYNIAAVAYDSKDDIRHSRIYNFQEETPHKEKVTALTSSWEQMRSFKPVRKDSDLRAQWEANIRRAKALKYTCVVQGFSPIDDPKIIWRPNLLVNVHDEILNFDSQLLINTVTFDYGLDNGSRTTLELVDKDTFTLELIAGIKEKKTKGGKVEGYDFNEVK